MSPLVTQSNPTLCRATQGDERFLWADPAATLVVAVCVFFVIRRLIANVFRDLMEAAPPDFDVAALLHTLEACSGVAAVHDLHVWSIGSGKTLVTAHVDAVAGQNSYELLEALQEVALARGVVHSTFQICSGATVWNGSSEKSPRGPLCTSAA